MSYGQLKYRKVAKISEGGGGGGGGGQYVAGRSYCSSYMFLAEFGRGFPALLDNSYRVLPSK